MAITTAFIMMGGFFMIGLYVAGALGVLSLVIMYFFSDAPLWNIMGNKAWETNANFILIAIPLFLLMGELMLRSGMGERMYGSLSRWLNFLPGGLIHTNIASCAVFAACSGSSVATSATISRVALPTFRQRGYSERLVIGSLAAGGTLGILIPPSIGLIVYGVLVEESIGRLYLAGFIPGFLLAAMMMAMIVGTALVFPGIAPKEPGTSFRLKVVGLLAMIPVGLIILVVLGSICAGLATPTEAAAFGVSGALVFAMINNSGPAVIGWFLQKLNGSGSQTGLIANLQERYPVIEGQMRQSMMTNWDMIKTSILSTVRTSSMIMLIVVAAFTLSFAFARLGISHDISQWIIGMDLSGTQLVIVLVVFYLLLGTFYGELCHGGNHGADPGAGAGGHWSGPGVVRDHHGDPGGGRAHQSARGHQPICAPWSAPGCPSGDVRRSGSGRASGHHHGPVHRRAALHGGDGDDNHLVDHLPADRAMASGPD